MVRMRNILSLWWCVQDPCFWVGEKVQSDQTSRKHKVVHTSIPSTMKVSQVLSSRPACLSSETLKDRQINRRWMDGWEK